MSKVICLLSGLVLLAINQPALAARALGPPIEELKSQPELTRIVLAKVSETGKAARIRFEVSERLSGDSPNEVLLRTDEETFADVVVGRGYLVAWTDLRRNRRVVGGWEKDPDGPSIIRIQGLGTTALFEDTPEIRFLFAPGTHTDPQRARQQIDALLALMQREDSRSRGLVIAQLYLRPDLTEIMDTAQAEVMKTVFQTQVLDPQHRDFLLRSALRLSRESTSPWLAEEFRRIIIRNGTQYDLASFVPGLVRTAARGLQQTGARSDIDLLGILLYSNNPGVAKAALSAMDRFDPQATVKKAEQAIGRGWLHGETRLALERYLNQVKSP